MKITVTYGTNIARMTDEIDPSTTTIRQFMDDHGLDYRRFTYHLGADVVTEQKMGKTFAENGVFESCFLTSVTKADSNLA